VLDIGAYSGLFAIGASLLGCSVLAFEPMPFNANRFEFNAANNGCKIALMRAAVSDKNGSVDITYNSKVPFTAGASLIRKKGPKLRVPSVTVDSFKFQQLTAIKMDVERAEPLVLKGALETLERCKPRMLVEALGESERAAVLASVPDFYRLADVIDVRNMVLLPC
jgi:FkbM family methyltransferase